MFNIKLIIEKEIISRIQFELDLSLESILEDIVFSYKIDIKDDKLMDKMFDYIEEELKYMEVTINGKN